MKSDLTGELRPGDGKCGNQANQDAARGVGHSENRTQMPAGPRFLLTLSPDTLRILAVGTERGLHGSPNGKYRIM
jgi:hypothetical protein